MVDGIADARFLSHVQELLVGDSGCTALEATLAVLSALAQVLPLEQASLLAHNLPPRLSSHMYSYLGEHHPPMQVRRQALRRMQHAVHLSDI